MRGKIVFVLLVLSSLLFAKDFRWDFENVVVGKLPDGWTVAATNPKKELSVWEVVQEKERKYLSLTKINNRYGGTFNLCFTNAISFLNGEISVKFRANSGEIDQGGGIMWRVQDADNYLVARFNPLEDNFRFYSVLDGVRRELASVDVRLDAGWHEMKIVQHGKFFEGYLDGKKLLMYDLSPLTKSGGVGLWTKADAASSFDDFRVKKAE